MADKYLKIQEVCELLKVSRSTVNRWISSRKLQSKKIGRLVRVSGQDLAVFVEVQAYHAGRKTRKGFSK